MVKFYTRDEQNTMQNKIFTLNIKVKANFAVLCTSIKSKVQNSSITDKLFFSPCTIFLKLHEHMFPTKYH